MHSRFPIAVLLLAVPAVSQEQKHLTVATPSNHFPISVVAEQIERDGPYPSLIRLAGNVEIKTPVCLPVGPNQSQVCDGYMLLHADKATLHEDTGEIEAQGNVTVIPLRHEK